MDVRSARLVQAGIMAAMLLVFVGSPGVMADEDAAVVAMTAYTGVAFSEWCVDNGLILDGCQSPQGHGKFDALVSCFNNSCTLNGFWLKDNWGTISCTTQSAFSEMFVEGTGIGGCSLIFFNNDFGVCQLQVSTDTKGGITGETLFSITTNDVVGCLTVTA